MPPDAGDERGDPLARLRAGRTLIVSGTAGGSRRYRCEHRIEQLRLLDAEADLVPTDEWDAARSAEEYDFFVLHRVGWRRKLPEFLAATRRRRKPVLYESDDLVFDPEAASLRAPLPNATPESMREKQRLQERTLAGCDGATVSTEPLAESARERNREVEVVPNVVTRAMIEAGASARRGGGGPVTLGYFSGTATHDKDFAEAADAVLHVLATRPEVRLLVVGPLELDDRFSDLGERLRRVEKVPWQELPPLLASVDVSLAPLESGNRFARGKSCVKFLEAALVDVPTIASPIPDFERVIADGENGLIARDEAGWASCIERLVADPDLRRRLGHVAGEHVRRHETTDARAEELGRTLAGLFERGRPSLGDAGTATARTAVRRARRALAPLRRGH